MTKKEQQQTLLELKDAHAKHTSHVNRALKKAGLPLRVKSIQYELAASADEVPVDRRLGLANCCFIDGHFVCGPQCP